MIVKIRWQHVPNQRREHPMLMDELFVQVFAYIQRVRNTQGSAIEAAARLVLDTLKLGH